MEAPGAEMSRSSTEGMSQSRCGWGNGGAWGWDVNVKHESSSATIGARSQRCWVGGVSPACRGRVYCAPYTDFLSSKRRDLLNSGCYFVTWKLKRIPNRQEEQTLLHEHWVQRLTVNKHFCVLSNSGLSNATSKWPKLAFFHGKICPPQSRNCLNRSLHISKINFYFGFHWYSR